MNIEPVGALSAKIEIQDLVGRYFATAQSAMDEKEHTTHAPNTYSLATHRLKALATKEMRLRYTIASGGQVRR